MTFKDDDEPSSSKPSAFAALAVDDAGAIEEEEDFGGLMVRVILHGTDNRSDPTIERYKSQRKRQERQEEE